MNSFTMNIFTNKSYNKVDVKFVRESHEMQVKNFFPSKCNVILQLPYSITETPKFTICYTPI